VGSFKRAIEIEESPRRYELLAASHARLEQWLEAEAAFRRGLELAPNNPNMRSNLGVALVHLGRSAEAAELFEEVLRRDPHNTTTERMLAELRSQREASPH
jgi:Flp pilus assembly protein TadD